MPNFIVIDVISKYEILRVHDFVCCNYASYKSYGGKQLNIDYYHVAEFKKFCVYYGFLCFLIIRMSCADH
jgi:hypothetical protein